MAVLAPFAVFYVAVLATMERAQEAFHFVQYGAFGALPYGALAARRPDLVRPALGSILVTALAGWADEGIEALLPERYYDLRDVGFNALAGVIAAVAITAWRLARRRRSLPGSAC